MTWIGLESLFFREHFEGEHFWGEAFFFGEHFDEEHFDGEHFFPGNIFSREHFFLGAFFFGEHFDGEHFDGEHLFGEHLTPNCLEHAFTSAHLQLRLFITAFFPRCKNFACCKCCKNGNFLR